MTIKPFCIKSEDITDVELNEMLSKCVELGANIYDWVGGYNVVCYFSYKKDECKYWGVNCNGETFASGDINIHNHNLLTKEQAFQMLDLTNEIQANKPNWDNAPEWANYLAMDNNGEWYWYENEPFACDSIGVWDFVDGEAKEAYLPCHDVLEPYKEWRKSLESRPE